MRALTIVMSPLTLTVDVRSVRSENNFHTHLTKAGNINSIELKY